ncbi:MAG: zinc-ribbon domain-containing protein [Lachnospiraceae bacterium]|nr:zinc-ribbon domain-containing protein [Lachnospiraceae bacterium]
MFCTNCGKELPEGANVCPYCGTDKLFIPGLEEWERNEVESEKGGVSEEHHANNLEQQEENVELDETKAGKDKWMNLVGIVCAAFLLIGLCIGAKNWIQSNFTQHKLYTAMYDSAVEEVEELLSDASNLEIEDYDKDNVVFQEFEYYDFGYGRLRYARYAVTVPAEWDAIAGHMDESLTIRVFYYTSDQNVRDGVDTSVPDHIKREDVSHEYDDLIEDLGNLGNFDN